MTNQWHALKDWTSEEFVDATDFNEQLRDNLEFLKSRPFNMVNNTARTTTSATFVEMTGSSIALTTYGGNVWIVANGKVSNTNAATSTNIDIAIDSTRVGDATNGLTAITHPVANYTDCVNVSWFTSVALSAASHNFSIFWKCSANTSSGLFRLYVIENR